MYLFSMQVYLSFYFYFKKKKQKTMHLHLEVHQRPFSVFCWCQASNLQWQKHWREFQQNKVLGRENSESFFSALHCHLFAFLHQITALHSVLSQLNPVSATLCSCKSSCCFYLPFLTRACHLVQLKKIIQNVYRNGKIKIW